VPNQAIHSLEHLDQLDIAAGCAALSLVPANADETDLLGSLASAGLREGRGAGQPPPWTELINNIGDFHGGPRWDLHETSWVEPLAFYGGQFLLFTDGDPGSVFHLRQVLQSVLLGTPVGESLPLQRELLRLSTAVLKLSDYLVQAAGARRYEPAGPRSERGPVLPEPDRFATLKAAVDMSEEHLAKVIGTDPAILEPLVRNLDTEGALPTSAQTNAPAFDRFPLLRREDRYVVIGATRLATALRHQLISMLVKAGHREALAQRLWQTSLAEVIRCARRMNWELLGVKRPEPGKCVGAAVFGFDSDKAAAVTILGDDLRSWDHEAPDGLWDATALSDESEAIMAEAEEEMMVGEPPHPNELLHVVLLAGCGRAAIFGLKGGQEPLEAPRIPLSAEGLFTISLAGTDECELWKFARASGALHESAEVMPASPLDEYAAWRNNGRSFYYGDEARPNLIVFDSSFGRALREQVAAKRDPHPAPISGQISEVLRLHDDPEIPIYVRANDLSDQEKAGPRQMVEVDGVTIWVTSPPVQGAERATYWQLVDCVAYWIWQLSPALPVIPAALASATIELELEVETPDVWTGASSPRGEGSVASFAVHQAGARVVIHPIMATRLDRPDNEAERELARILLEGIGTLVEAWGGEAPDSDQVEIAIQRHVPLGPKKKINLTSEVNEIALLGGPLPPYRPLQDADAEPLLDHAGELLAAREDLEVGEIPAERAGEILNLIVADHFDQFAAMIATLSPTGLLEALVAVHESAIHQEAVSRFTFGAQAACFDETKLIADLAREIPQSANTAIALRFTIEYVVTCPPRGLRPLSRDFLDQILALAGQIANRGLISDVVIYELGDLQLELLPSGRLGIERQGGYLGGQQAYLQARIPSQAEAAVETYADLWKKPAVGRPAGIDAIDAAAVAEWGVSMTQLAELHGELVQAAMRRSMTTSTALREELRDELVRELGFEVELIERGLEMLTLGPRSAFLKPPKPYVRPDVYPWRFNRELSYLRRPLLVRSGPDGEEIVWGPRHIDASGRQLLNLVLSERLKANSPAMQRLMTELRQKETARFVEEVGRRCEEAGMVVQTNVEKINGKKILKEDGDIAGDLDLLAANPETRVLHIRECKDLEMARTPAETHNELERTFAVGGKKRSAADKHLKRIEWVKENLAEVLVTLGLPREVEGWRVVGGFVVDTELLSPYIYECPLPVTPLARLIENLRAAEA
jgi:hypothetical protein